MQLSTTQTRQRIDRVLACRYHLADHREEWSRILPGLEKLHAMGLSEDWSIESLRKMLDEDLAMILMDDKDPCGFAVVYVDTAKYDKKAKELFIYMVWHQGGDAIARFQPHLDQFAAHCGAKYIRFYSPRRAFLRVAKRIGYQPRAIEYVKELQP
jgi:hypothetical protein